MGRRLTGTWRVLLIVLVLFVAFRLTLPYILTRYVNNVLSGLEGYHGQFQDIDVHLYRGAYQIDSLRIFKTEGNKEIPFIDIPVADFSLQWSAILNGALVGEITFERPTLNFIAQSNEHSVPNAGMGEQNGSNVDWSEPIRKLMGLDVNRFLIHDGRVTFHDLSTEPNVNLFLYNVELDALNLTNAKGNPENLPSRIYLQALSIGNGQLNLAMRMNLLKQQPDLDLDLRFENVDLKALNNFFQAYAGTGVVNGTSTLYSQISLKEGKITGYLNPLFNDLQTTGSRENAEETIQLAWASMVGNLADVFENQRRDQFATKVEVKGQLRETEASVVPELWRVFGDAFLQAFENSAASKVSSLKAPRSARKDSAPVVETRKDKKELRREKRKEKREQRRRAKKDKKKEESENANKSNEPADSEG